MSNLRRRFDRFCFRNRDKGIPNLMLYVVLGNALVAIMSMINGGSALYAALMFDKTKILQGEVWRLVTYVFTQTGNDFMELIFIYFFYLLGRAVENSMGTLKFNLYYFSGVILMDIFAMIFCPVIPAGPISLQEEARLIVILSQYAGMAFYLHLSLILVFATMHPDSQFMLLLFIPIKAWVMALFYLVIVLVSVLNMSTPVMFFPHNLFPLVALANYFLFTGSDILNLFPGGRSKPRASRKNPRPKVVQFRGSENHKSTPKENYNHRCEICGRTDVTNPELEFRYCSRCTGYRCYCENHIGNHIHE